MSPTAQLPPPRPTALSLTLPASLRLSPSQAPTLSSSQSPPQALCTATPVPQPTPQCTQLPTPPPLPQSQPPTQLELPHQLLPQLPPQPHPQSPPTVLARPWLSPEPPLPVSSASLLSFCKRSDPSADSKSRTYEFSCR